MQQAQGLILETWNLQTLCECPNGGATEPQNSNTKKSLITKVHACRHNKSSRYHIGINPAVQGPVMVTSELTCQRTV